VSPGHLLPYQGRDAVPQAGKGVLDVVSTATFQGVVMGTSIVVTTLRTGGREKGGFEKEKRK